MPMRNDGSGLSHAIIVTVLILLPVVAVLQYRWIGRVSEAEHDHMQSILQGAAARFSRDFDEEITKTFLGLQGRREGRPASDLTDYGERFARWSATSPDARLVRNLYAARKHPQGGIQLLLYSRAQDRFVEIQWPPDFARLRNRLEAMAQGQFGPGRPPLVDAVDEGVPTLIAPLPAAPGFPGRSLRGPNLRPPEPSGWAIAELDLDFIRHALLPELVQQHFGGGDSMEYDLQIVSRSAPGTVIFRSNKDLPPGAFQWADAVIDIFELRPELVFANRRPNAGPRREPGMFAPPGGPGNRGRWELRVRHRAGSLETAVAQARRRNLAISSLVLILMSTSFIMLAVATRRAQRLARQQMEFAAGVSHELRTPLTVICSAADNLADGVVADDHQIRRYGSLIRNEGRRLSHMVEEILAFTGTQAGRVRQNLQEVNICIVVDRALAACAPEIQESGCEIEKHIDPDLPPVMSDPTSLTHCLRNLLSNALKHARTGKWIGIRAALDQPGAHPAVRISVEDRGPGIDPAELPHVFEPFFRGEQARADQVHGTGVGLSLVKRIVEAHGGAVSVTSLPGRGCCFTLALQSAANPNRERA